MKTLLEIINKNNFFYIGSLLLIFVCCLFLSIYSRADGFMFMNGFHTTFLTIFFQNITLCGDGAFSLIVFTIILISFKKHRKLAILLLLSYVSSGILSQIIKLFVTSPRPSVYFESHHYAYYLDTFSNCRIGFRSFPSGHTASAFAMVTVFTNYLKKRHIWAFSLLFAIVVGYSRIYLAHHFLIDVLAGAILGILSGTFSILWFKKNQIKIKKRTRQFTRKFNLVMQNIKTQHKPNINGSY
ncbi:phosphatase PAP2 family protein [Flavobacterium sp. IMCC34518]|uniref:phosphatase PAP2 family protein n=1 Tax=Flavobacterium sp. IMCC34518 TaxID=3003623 RepID=UPI0024829AD4|nr:phosphatase PAP2 family protein [Flavobacterium sp. IMCC34518]